MRYKIEERSWDGETYLVVVDTERENESDPYILCQQPLEFYAYPEGAFIESSIDDSECRRNFEQIIEALNNHPCE